MVNFKYGTIQLNDLIIDNFTQKKEISVRDDWRLHMEAGEYTRFIYIGVEDPELYAIHLCFKAEELQYINFWPRAEHCIYHSLPERESADIHFFCTHGELMVKEVTDWLLNKQGKKEKRYAWGIATLVNDLDRGFQVCVRMKYVV